MTKELEFLAYAMEKYRFAKGMTPAEVLARCCAHRCRAHEPARAGRAVIPYSILRRRGCRRPTF